ncbi:hypothetical protein PHLCEN_2v6031 [Hermanssonia centrifuga]|uniref:BTB domain-containing protein n=1 Tax=Hermanssonia centrifuga TaxID=98765 RepID=A0A2R6P0M0_9APHY|nr:hypothetical protein PHLCEN_2v6031 [Hermanssonia centrifuga]
MANISDNNSSPPLSHPVNGDAKALSSQMKSSTSFWFNDGSVIARLRDNTFKLHRSLLDRHSPYFASLPSSESEEQNISIVCIPDERATLFDFTTLLEHLYHDIVATTSHFDHEDPAQEHPTLSRDVTVRCASLQDSLISHFTPILFTVATASHMACTDMFAEKWMPLVITPALETNGLCSPIETLRKIQKIKWEDEGLCIECCKEKREEWEGEAKSIWDKLDGWLGI